MTRARAVVRRDSNDSRSVDSFARWRWPPTPSVEPENDRDDGRELQKV